MLVVNFSWGCGAWNTRWHPNNTPNVNSGVRGIKAILTYTRMVTFLTYLGQIATTFCTVLLITPRHGMERNNITLIKIVSGSVAYNIWSNTNNCESRTFDILPKLNDSSTAFMALLFYLSARALGYKFAY
jgi:hypothetical protein